MTLSCIITGGSRGFGHALSEYLASQGANVAICARSKNIGEVANTLAEKYDTKVIGMPLDIKDQEACKAFTQTVYKTFGNIDVLVNNAAIVGPVGMLSETSPERFVETLEINVGGTANMIRATAPHMGNSGSIINVAGAGTGSANAPERLNAYRASKAAVVALTEAISGELAPIRINAVAPGVVLTEFLQEVLEQGAGVAGQALYESTKAAQEKSPPDLSQFFSLVWYLASPESDWLTGRLLSARWETPEKLADSKKQIVESSRYTLRRIDDELFKETDQ